MKIILEQRPGSTAARITLQAGETCTAEAGAMIAVDEHVSVSTSTHKPAGGGVLRAVRRSLGGESFFLNHFTAGNEPGELLLAPALAGDMMEYSLDNAGLIVQAGSFVACGDGVDVDMNWQGFKSMLSGESMFWLKVSGSGTVLLNSFGCIYSLPLERPVTVDTGHIMAFDEGLSFSIGKPGRSWLGAFLGGEGLVCKFTGKGTVWCQSHTSTGFGRLLGPKLKPRSK